MLNSLSARAVAEHFIIEHVGHRGDGVAAGSAIYVSGTLPGEHIEAEPIPGQPDRRRVVHISQPSPDRIDPFCDHFGTCGGCAIQHWEPSAYRAWKRGLVIEALTQAKVSCEIGDLIDAHGDGRRRATFHARLGSGDDLVVGFAAQGSHAIVPIERCPILAPSLAGALDAARAIAGVLAPTRKPLDIQVTATDNGIDIDVRGSGPLDTARLSELSALAARHKLARISRHGELVTMRTPPVASIGKAKVVLPMGSFMQPTAAGEETLASLVMTHARKAKHVADLFCGIGPFALRLAQTTRVDAFDSDSPAIGALNDAVRNTQGLKPLKAETRDLFRRPLVPQELRLFDAVVFDPPRQGAQAQAEQLAKSKVPLVIAVSCSPATFARDARILIDAGYTISDVRPVDQFRHTPHVEVVAAFKRR